MNTDNSAIEKACAFTGHRPFRFAFGYDEGHALCRMIKSEMQEACTPVQRIRRPRFLYWLCARARSVGRGSSFAPEKKVPGCTTGLCSAIPGLCQPLVGGAKKEAPQDLGCCGQPWLY